MRGLLIVVASPVVTEGIICKMSLATHYLTIGKKNNSLDLWMAETSCVIIFITQHLSTLYEDLRQLKHFEL